MDNAALWLAITARAQTDTGTGGLLNSSSPLVGGIFPNVAPTDTLLPYIVFDVGSLTGDHAFAKDIYDISVRFNVYVAFKSSAISDPMLRASQIINRVIGNWSSASPNTAPTYGFHRHRLVLASGDYTAQYMVHTGSLIAHEESFLHFVEQFRLISYR